MVHAHRHYIKRTYRHFHRNEFSQNLKQVNRYFCQKELPIYWVFDTDFWPRRNFPIRRCNSRRLESKWGGLGDYSLKLDNHIVLTGIYFGNCVSRAYRSLRNKFIKDPKRDQFYVHIPLKATIGYYGKDYRIDTIKKWFMNEHFIKTHQIREEDQRNYQVEFFVGQELVQKYRPNQEYVGVNAKVIRIHLWNVTSAMIDYLDRFAINERDSEYHF